MTRILAWLRDAIGAASPEEMTGLQLEGPYWEVNGRGVKPSPFFRSVGQLLPSASVVCLEGGDQPLPLRDFLERHSVPPRAQVARGTYWPRASVFHLPATPEHLTTLADLAGPLRYPEVCDHLHTYDDQGVFLQWYDAFAASLFLSKRVPEGAVSSFCTTLNIPLHGSSGAVTQ